MLCLSISSIFPVPLGHILATYCMNMTDNLSTALSFKNEYKCERYTVEPLLSGLRLTVNSINRAFHRYAVSLHSQCAGGVVSG
jgi:molecular chaperone GrpE (heat shock protein)